MKAICTIGYEGASLPDFISTLIVADVQAVIDVRELPLSRRKGFSKTPLTIALDAVGIAYVHLRDLGDPKIGREAARAGRYSEFRRIYAKHLQTAKAQASLAELRSIAASTRACLVCYERDPSQCHRTMVASALADLDQVRIVHLGVQSGAGDNAGRKLRYRASGGLGQGLAAAE